MDGTDDGRNSSNRTIVIHQTDELTSDSNIEKMKTSNSSEVGKVADLTSKDDLTAILSDVDESAMIWNTCEPWRGLVKERPDKRPNDEINKTSKRRKLTNLDKCEEWDFLKDATSPNIPLLKNGSVSGAVKLVDEIASVSGKVKRVEKIMTVHETCAIDSILQLQMCAIALSRKYKEEIEGSTVPTIKLALSIFEDGKITTKHYAERAKTLSKLRVFADKISQYTRGIWKLNANCNVADLAYYLFGEQPSCTREEKCSCGYKKTRASVTVNVNIGILLCQGLQYMQQAIDTNAASKLTCRECSRSLHEDVRYGPHAIIDTSIFTDPTYNERNTELKHDLDAVPKTIKLGGKLYRLIGAINYYKYAECNTGQGRDDGHYVAFAYTGLRWYRYDDTKKHREIANGNTVLTPHIIWYIRVE